MQCRICGFENMPGLEVCTHCGTSLKFTGPRDVKDFMPPRAGRLKNCAGCFTFAIHFGIS